MKFSIKILFSVLTIIFLTNCNNNIIKVELQKAKQNSNSKVQFLEKHSDSCSCIAQLELEDSLTLVHIKEQFYKSKTGHLYEKTMAQRELNGDLSDVVYFNGFISQEIDPFSFVELEGWYAKDNKKVYYYRPTSGGMQISKLEKADIKSFKILDGHYKYASDKNYFYDKTEIIEGFNPSKTIFTYDNKKRITEINCGKKRYNFEIIN